MDECDEARGERSGVAATLAAGLVPITFPLVTRPYGLAFPKHLYLPVHTALEVVVVAAGVATFAIQWFAAGTRGRTLSIWRTPVRWD